jgi:predicted metal-dependent RNase
MRIVNLNPDMGIGASAWFVDLEGHKLLMDTGTHPKCEGRESLPLYDLIKTRNWTRSRSPIVTMITLVRCPWQSVTFHGPMC